MTADKRLSRLLDKLERHEVMTEDLDEAAQLIRLYHGRCMLLATIQYGQPNAVPGVASPALMAEDSPSSALPAPRSTYYHCETCQCPEIEAATQKTKAPQENDCG